MAERSLTKPLRVLVVEDNEDHALLLQRAFKGKKWQVDVAVTGHDALEMSREPYDVILLDYKLPDADGLELLDKLREHNPRSAVIFVTGQGSEDVAMRALSHGAMDYVTKRSGYDLTVADVVEEALTKQQAMQTIEAAPSREVLEKILTNMQLGGVVKAMMVTNLSGTVLAYKLPKTVKPEAVAQSVARMRAEMESLSSHFKSGAVYLHVRFGALGVILESIGNDGILATFIDPPEAVASARVATRQAIDAIRNAWRPSGNDDK